MMIRELAVMVESLTGWTLGKKLHMGHLPQTAPKRYVLMLEQGGAPEFHPNEDMIAWAIQFFNLSADYMEAHDDAWTLYQQLHGLCGMNLPRLDGSGEPYLVQTIEALAVPQYLGEDDNRNHMFSTNYVFRMEEGSCASGA